MMRSKLSILIKSLRTQEFRNSLSPNQLKFLVMLSIPWQVLMRRANLRSREDSENSMHWVLSLERDGQGATYQPSPRRSSLIPATLNSSKIVGSSSRDLSRNLQNSTILFSQRNSRYLPVEAAVLVPKSTKSSTLYQNRLHYRFSRNIDLTSKM